MNIYAIERGDVLEMNCLVPVPVFESNIDETRIEEMKVLAWLEQRDTFLVVDTHIELGRASRVWLRVVTPKSGMHGWLLLTSNMGAVLSLVTR